MIIQRSADPNVLGLAMFDGHAIRITGDVEQPWFVLADVCEAIELEGPRFVSRKLAEDEKGVHLLHTLGGTQKMTVISESGLYTVVMRCRDAMKEGTAAYRFRRWVTNEVLPSIRKTGKYEPVKKLSAIEPPDLLPGDRFASLTIVNEEPMSNGHRRVTVRCDCGVEFTTRATKVRSGNTTKCIVCSRKQKRLPAPPKTDAFLLETYQLAFVQSSKSEEAAAVMNWCHQQMLERASK